MEPTYELLLEYRFLNASIEGGLVEGSAHPENTIYLKVKFRDEPTTWLHEMTEEEAAAIISSLSHSLVAATKRLVKKARLWEEVDEEDGNASERTESVQVSRTSGSRARKKTGKT